MVDQEQSNKAKKKPAGSVIKDHPANKCTGCGNKMEWQERNNLPVCSKEACTFAKHPDFNKSNNWASSFIGKTYAENVKAKNGKPVYQLSQSKCLLRDEKGKIVFPVKLINNDKVSLNLDYKDIKKFLRSNNDKQVNSSSTSDLKDNGEELGYSSQSFLIDKTATSSKISSQECDEVAKASRIINKEDLSFKEEDLDQ